MKHEFTDMIQHMLTKAVATGPGLSGSSAMDPRLRPAFAPGTVMEAIMSLQGMVGDNSHKFFLYNNF